jgi:hypothetical protein
LGDDQKEEATSKDAAEFEKRVGEVDEGVIE